MKNFFAAAPLCLVLFNATYSLNTGLLDQYGGGSAEPLLTKKVYSLITWNVYKTKTAGSIEDLTQLSNENDFVVVQEFSMSKAQKEAVDKASTLQWSFAKSFQDGVDWTGVTTISKYNATEVYALKSPKLEPVTKTPKMSLVSKYNLSNGEQLWLVNLHGLNFDMNSSSFKSQIDAVIAEMKTHSGPLLFAGDFNTWNQTRREYLLQKTLTINLVRVSLENPIGVLSKTLDHIFARDISVVSSSVLSNIKTSDHNPLRIEFIIP